MLKAPDQVVRIIFIRHGESEVTHPAPTVDLGRR
jgi:hypothetical protein